MYHLSEDQAELARMVLGLLGDEAGAMALEDVEALRALAELGGAELEDVEWEAGEGAVWEALILLMESDKRAYAVAASILWTCQARGWARVRQAVLDGHQRGELPGDAMVHLLGGLEVVRQAASYSVEGERAAIAHAGAGCRSHRIPEVLSRSKVMIRSFLARRWPWRG